MHDIRLTSTHNIPTYADQANFEMPTDMKKMAYGGFEVAVEG